MLRLRPATLADAPVLARVHIASWRGAYRGIMPDAVLDGASEEAFTANWVKRLTHMPRSTLVAEAGDDVIGFAAAGPSRDPDALPQKTGELYALYLLPEYRGAGTGGRLWRAMRQSLVVEQFAEVTLWVLEANERARAFYERAGFQHESGAVKAIPRNGIALPEVRYRSLLA